MSRLIDAEKIIDKFDPDTWQGEMMIAIARGLPTAYDVEKVVEGLELENKRLKTLKNNCIALCDHEVIGIENKAYDYAIKIVRNGGKDE